MIRMRIKRFSRQLQGGVIKVPAQGTTIAGFDFDIDKLYYLMHEYKVRELSKPEIAEIWARFYRKNPQIFEALRNARNNSDPKATAMADAFIKAADEGDDSNALVVMLQSFLKKEVTENSGELEIKDSEDSSKRKLYTFWKEVGLEGTPEDAFMNELFTDVAPYLENYDFEKTPLENSRENRNNVILDLMIARLEDRETFKNRYTPGGFKHLSKAARIMRELFYSSEDDLLKNGINGLVSTAEERSKDKKTDPEPNYDPSNPETILIYNQQNQIAGKLIGVFANMNTNHAFAKFMDKFELRTPITLCGNTFGNLIKNEYGRDVDTIVAECLSSSVDAVKDPVLNFLNANTITANSIGLLARLGFTGEEIGYFLNQPAIRLVCEESFDEESYTSQAIDSIREQLQEALKAKNESESYDKSYNPSANELAYNIFKTRDNYQLIDEWSAEMIRKQLAILDKFEEINTTASELADFIAATKFTASNSVKSTMGDMYEQKYRVEKYIANSTSESSKLDMVLSKGFTSALIDDDTIETSTDEEYVEAMCGKGDGNPFAYEQCNYDLLKKARKLLMKYFPYEHELYRGVRDLVKSLTFGNVPKADIINKIHSELMLFLLANKTGGRFDRSFVREFPTDVNSLTDRSKWKELTNEEYYLETFPKILTDLLSKEPKLRKYEVLAKLNPDKTAIIKNGQATAIVGLNISEVGGLEKEVKDSIRESWGQLQIDRPDLARDLFFYNFYKAGFKFGVHSFMHLCPTIVKENIAIGTRLVEDPTTGETIDVHDTYIDFVRSVVKGEHIDNLTQAWQKEFLKQFILNHPEDKQLIYHLRPNSKAAKTLESKIKTNGVLVDAFELMSDPRDLGTKDISNSPFIRGIDKDNNRVTWVAAIEYNDVIYIADANNGSPFSTTTTDEPIIYRRYDIQGDGNNIIRYFNTTQDSDVYGIGAMDIEYIEASMLGSTLGSEDSQSIRMTITETRDFLINKANDYINRIQGSLSTDNLSMEERMQANQNLINLEAYKEGLEDSADDIVQQYVKDYNEGLEANDQPIELIDDAGNKVC